MQVWTINLLRKLWHVLSGNSKAAYYHIFFNLAFFFYFKYEQRFFTFAIDNSFLNPVDYMSVMLIKLKTLLFMLILGVNAFAGTPLQVGMNSMKLKSEACRPIQSIKCCKEKIKSCNPEKENATYICCILVGHRNIPANTTSTFQIDFAPIVIALEKSDYLKSLFSTSTRKFGNEALEDSVGLINLPPKYIQHQKFLI